MVEQFLETVPIDMCVWLVDQKPKTIDDMARLSDRYVALRNPVDPVLPKSLLSHNDSFSTVALSKPVNSTTTRPFHKGDNRKQSNSFFSVTSSSPKWFERFPSSTVRCAYFKMTNHKISECRKRKTKRERLFGNTRKIYYCEQYGEPSIISTHWRSCHSHYIACASFVCTIM